MSKGFFSKLFSSQKDDPLSALPEERWLPEEAKSVSPPKTFWVTTNVFADKKNKGARTYYAFVYNADDPIQLKSIYKCSYYVGQNKGELNVEAYEPDFRRAVSRLAQLEKIRISQPQLFAPVPELRGNYRNLASLQHLHFNDAGNCIPIGKKTLVASEALFKRETLDALYGEEKKEPAAPTIATWDDFYEVIIRKDPAQGALETLTESTSYSRFVADSHKMLEVLKDVHHRVTEGEWDHVGNVTLPKPSVLRAGEGLYQYYTTAITMLLRSGAVLYQKCTTTIPADTQTLAVLSSLGNSVRSIARNQLGFSAETAEQIVNIIVQGADPYADKLLPLEELLEKYPPDSSQPTAKKKPSKGYSP